MSIDTSAPPIASSPIVGERPTSAEVFYASWGMDLLRGSLQALGEAHQRVAALAAVLLGGGVAFLDPAKIGPVCRWIAFLSLIAALVASMLGGFPFSRSIVVNDPDAVREFASAALARKSRLLWAGYIALGFGLAVAVFGVMVH